MLEQKTVKIFKSLNLIAFMLLVCSILFRVYCSNHIAIKNADLKELSIKKEELEKELSRLSFIDSQLASLDDIEKTAMKLGYVELVDSLTLINPDTPIPVASADVPGN